MWDDARKIASLCLLIPCLGLIPASVTAGPPPVITAQPLDQSVPLGGTAVFQVTVTSGTALSYQWYKDELPMPAVLLPGQNTDTLLVHNVSPLDFGTYFVEVKNAGGSVVSRHASLSLLGTDVIPVGQSDDYVTDEDQPLVVPAPGVLANDGDGVTRPLFTAVLAGNVTQGSLTLDPDGRFIYVPYSNFFGSDSFTYVPYNGAIAGNPVIVTLNVAPVNDPPIAVTDTVNIQEDGSINVRVLDNDVDPEDESLTVIGASTTNGTAVVNNSGSGGRVRFTPDPDFHGVAVFSYVVTDGKITSTGLVMVTVMPVNDAPVANDDAYATTENTGLITPVAVGEPDGLVGAGVLANDTDVDGDGLRAVLITTVSHGTLDLNADGSFSYMPEAGFSGTDTFTYCATDGAATGNVATVTITVTPPVAQPKVVGQRMTQSGFELQIAIKEPARIVIMASPDLQTWSPLSTNDVPPGLFIFTDAEALAHNARFYHVRNW